MQREMHMSQLTTQSPPKVTPESKVTPEYRDAVTKLAEERKNQRFLNDSPEHAKLLAELMIGRSDENDDVLIYSEKLPLSCFGDALNNSKSAKIRVLLDDVSGVEEIKKLSPEVSSRITSRVLKGPDGSHFFLTKNSFRLEIDHAKAKAVANFNDPEAIHILRSRFESLWTNAA